MDKSMKPCPSCSAEHTSAQWKAALYTCPSCGFHQRIIPNERIEILLDEGSFTETNKHIKSLNPLEMDGYEEKLSKAKFESEMNEAVVTGTGMIDGRPAVFAFMNFKFMGGSMGSVVGEKITRAMLLGAEKGLPVIIYSTSGGARMQEGIFSLMQMAKTSSAAALLERSGQPLFVVLCDPTYGGVTASFAMLGDVTLAEPGALIGFAGPRVIEGTIRQKLPEGFQTAEFQLQKGFVDTIAPRSEQRKILSFLIDTHKAPEGIINEN